MLAGFARVDFPLVEIIVDMLPIVCEVRSAQLAVPALARLEFEEAKLVQ